MKLQNINELIKPIITSEGFIFVGAELNQGGYRHRLIIYVDKPGMPINLDECATLSRRMSAVLDVEGVLTDNAYVLEVSSPGIDRPLFTQEQIIEQVGQPISLQLKTSIEGRKNFKGLLTSANETELVLQIEKDDKKEVEMLVIQADLVVKAKLRVSENILNKSRKRGNPNELGN